MLCFLEGQWFVFERDNSLQDAKKKCFDLREKYYIEASIRMMKNTTLF